MNADLKKLMERVKAAQDQFHKLMNNQEWMDELKKYAERQGEEVKKLFAEDLEKVRTFIEKERKDLAKLQKQLPGEVQRFRSLIAKQRKELEKVLKTARKASAKKAGGKKRAPKAKGAVKAPSVKAARKKASAKASS